MSATSAAHAACCRDGICPNVIVTGIEEARKIVGEDKIIGISAGNIEEAITACKAGADYLGIGAVYATSTYAHHVRR